MVNRALIDETVNRFDPVHTSALSTDIQPF